MAGVVNPNNNSYLILPIDSLRPVASIPKPPGTPRPVGAVPAIPTPVINGLGAALNVQAPLARMKVYDYGNGLVGFVSDSIGLITQHMWILGDGTQAFGPTHIHKYSIPGPFFVSLTVSNSTHSITATYSLSISLAPVLSAVDYSYVVSGLGVQFTDLSTKSGSRLWDFGDGTINTQPSPYHHYAVPGIYNVTLAIQGSVLTKQVSVDYGIVLNWTDNSSDETGFRIEHSLDGASWSTLATVAPGVTTYTVTLNQDGVDPAVLNYFRVYAYNGGGDSASPTNAVSTLCGV